MPTALLHTLYKALALYQNNTVLTLGQRSEHNGSTMCKSNSTSEIFNWTQSACTAPQLLHSRCCYARIRTTECIDSHAGSEHKLFKTTRSVQHRAAAVCRAGRLRPVENLSQGRGLNTKCQPLPAVHSYQPQKADANRDAATRATAARCIHRVYVW